MSSKFGECDTWSLTTFLPRLFFKYFQHQTTFCCCCCCSKLCLFVLWRIQSQNFRLNFIPLSEAIFYPESKWAIKPYRLKFKMLNDKFWTQYKNLLSWFLAGTVAMFWPGPANEASTLPPSIQIPPSTPTYYYLLTYNP